MKTGQLRTYTWLIWYNTESSMSNPDLGVILTYSACLLADIEGLLTTAFQTLRH